MFGLPKPCTLLIASGCAVGLILASAGAGGRLAYKYEHGKLVDFRKVVRERDAARVLAVRAAADSSRAQQADISLHSVEVHTAAKTRIVTQTETVIREVPVYVTPAQDRVACVSFGLVRVLNAAAEGRNAADYQLPPGVTDDTCTDVEASALATWVSGNYGAGRLNAEQLNALIADIRQRIDAANRGGAL